MEKRIHYNKGFTLVELLIAMAILGIITIMIVQFMSTTSGAYRKTKKNVNVQIDSLQTMDSISDTLSQANYIRVGVSASDNRAYTIVSKTKKDSGSRVSRSDQRKIEVVTGQPALNNIDYDLVPDNFANYGLSNKKNKVVLDFDTYEILDEKTGAAYKDGSDNIRSFRALMPKNTNYYIKPEYIYIQYTAGETSTGSAIPATVMYHIVKNTSGSGYKIFVYRTQHSVKYDQAKKNVDLLKEDNVEGLLTDKIADFYLSANSDGNAVLLNVMFENNGYYFNANEPVKFRNSNVLTVRPQDLYKAAGSASSATEDPNTGKTLGPDESTAVSSNPAD